LDFFKRSFSNEGVLAGWQPVAKQTTATICGICARGWDGDEVT